MADDEDDRHARRGKAGGGVTGGWGQLLGSLTGMADGPAGSVYKEWETWFAQQFERLAQNPGFAKHVGRAFELGGPLRGLIEGAVKTAVSGAVQGLPYARQDVVAELEARVARLERTVGRLQARADGATPPDGGAAPPDQDAADRPPT